MRHSDACALSWARPLLPQHYGRQSGRAFRQHPLPGRITEFLFLPEVNRLQQVGGYPAASWRGDAGFVATAAAPSPFYGLLNVFYGSSTSRPQVVTKNALNFALPP
jgi:hypothetical protein